MLHGTGALHAWHLATDHGHAHAAVDAHDAARAPERAPERGSPEGRPCGGVSGHADRHAHDRPGGAPDSCGDHPRPAAPAIAEGGRHEAHGRCSICDLLTAPRDAARPWPAAPAFDEPAGRAEAPSVGRFALQVSLLGAGPRAPPVG